MFLCSSSSCFKPCSSNHTYPNVARIPQVSCSSSILFLCGVGLLAYPQNTLSLRLSQFMQGKMLMRKIQENSYSHLLLFCFTESRLIIVLFFNKKKENSFSYCLKILSVLHDQISASNSLYVVHTPSNPTNICSESTTLLVYSICIEKLRQPL